MKNRKLWEKRLSSLKGYKKASEEADELGGKLPDARYTGKIEGAKLADSNAGNPQIVVNGKIVGDEEYEGEAFTAFMGLSEQSLRFTIATLKRLGFELEGDDPKEILDVVESLNSDKMTVILKVKDGYANISGPAEDVAESVDDDDEDDSEEDDDDKEEAEESKEDDDEEEETEDSSEEKEKEAKEPVEGSKVTWEKDGKTKTGTIIEILEDSNMARVEKEDGGITRVAMDLLTVVTEDSDSSEEEQEEEEEEVEEEKETKKATKAKPVKKAKKKTRR